MIDQVKIFKALGDSTRLKMVQCLLHKDICSCFFTGITGKDQSTNTRHLKVLVEAGLLVTDKQGRFIYYKIKDEKIRAMLERFGIKRFRCC